MGAQDLWWTCLWHTSPSAPGFRARQARNKRRWSVCVHVQFLSSGKRSAPRTCCWRRMWAPRTCTCDDLSTSTHPLQHRGFELDRQETSAAECVWVLIQFLQADPGFGYSSIHSKFLAHYLIDGKGRALVRRARSSLPDWWKRASPCWSGCTQICLIDGKGCAPVDQGTLKFAWLMEKDAPLLIRARSSLHDWWKRVRPCWSGRAQGKWNYWELTDSAYSIQMV